MSTYQVVSLENSSLAMAIDPGEMGQKEARVCSAATSNAAAQRWVFTDAGNGLVKISLEGNWDRYLQPNGYGNKDDIVASTLEKGGDRIHWRVTTDGNGFSKIENEKTRFYLYNDNADPDNNLTQRDREDKKFNLASAQWLLKPV